MDSFSELSTTRRYELGPIPWDRIIVYGHHAGLNDDIINSFVILIRMMDVAWQGWTREQIERARAKPPAKKR